MSTLEGHCLCGNVTYSVDDGTEPLMTVVCHCTVCQHQTGGPFSVNVVVPETAFHLNGDTVGEYVTTSEETQTPVQRKFCTTCGSPIVAILHAMPGIVAIKAGTLSDTSGVQPTAEIWARSKQPWVETNDDLGVFATGLPAS
ncbi:unannotated protein [freshwater metagenome]|uniref:Unannotated protein n=1 Tax=freshwater metagenome TaxID=449393 RepID=A0A6J7K9A4_9ZZZZ|nr:hypothetical protein [Actinomycetota bacterium]